MIFWNPFKPHIVEFGTGGFAIRKLTWAGWTCLSTYTSNNTWMLTRYFIEQYCVYSKSEDAVARLAKYNKRKPFWKLYAY